MDYRVWYKKVQEYKKRNDLSDGEKEELDNLNKLLKMKEEEITLKR